MRRIIRGRWLAWTVALVLLAACVRDEGEAATNSAGAPLGTAGPTVSGVPGTAVAPAPDPASPEAVSQARPGVGGPGIDPGPLGATCVGDAPTTEASIPGGVPALPADTPAAPPAAEQLPDSLPEPPPGARAELVEVAPNEFVVEGTIGEPAACGDCSCPTDGCSCGPLRSGGCLCVTIEGGTDCACTCGGLPSVSREVNVGSTGSPASGPATEAP